MELTGVVLAGGASERFGSDKLRFPVDGRSMLAHVVEVMREVAEEVVVSVRDPRTPGRLEKSLPSRVRWVPDRTDLAGAGPGAGMLTALVGADSRELLFLPGDMPWVEAEALRELLRRAKAGRASSVAPIRPDGFTEPLVQWQRVGPWKERLALLRTRRDPGVRPTDLLRGGRRVLLLPVGRLSKDPRCFVNVNTTSELAGRPAPPRGAARDRPTFRSRQAGRAFWAAVSASCRSDAAAAFRYYQEEARLHADSGLAHLRVHALEDALRSAREAGLPADGVERRLIVANRALHARSSAT